MPDFVDIAPSDFKISPFQWIGKEWMLIAAEKDGRTNAMTASWGGLGVMWGKPAAFAVIRPQRFTKEFVDASDIFSLNFFAPEHHAALEYMGSHSGRDGDKNAAAGLTVAHADGAPHFAEAKAVVVCRKKYAQPWNGEFFTDAEPDKTWYPNKDYHTFYVGEVIRIMAKPGSL